MRLVGSGGQQRQDVLYRSDLTLTGSAQLVIPHVMSRSYLLLQNTGLNVMYLEFGAGAAHCTLTSGAVSSVTVDNAGFGFTYPPLVRFLGGGTGPGNNSSYLGLNQPTGWAPSSVAQATAVLTGSPGSATIASVSVSFGGASYVKAPYVLLLPSDLDPYGASVPTIGTGVQLASGGKFEWNGTVCPTDAVSVIGTSGDILVCRWLD